MEIDLYEITRRFERLHLRGEWNWPISCLNDSQTQERGFECLNGGSSMTIKHVLFLALNMKQLNFRHFNTNSKKFCETESFFVKEAKTAPKRPILLCLVYQGVSAILRQFRIISSEDFQRLPTIPEDWRRCSKKLSPSRSFRKSSQYFLCLGHTWNVIHKLNSYSHHQLTPDNSNPQGK